MQSQRGTHRAGRGGGWRRQPGGELQLWQLAALNALTFVARAAATIPLVYCCELWGRRAVLLLMHLGSFAAFLLLLLDFQCVHTQVTAPRVTAPRVTTPRVTAPRVTTPKARRRTRVGAR
jgi:hypothetical protein